MNLSDLFKGKSKRVEEVNITSEIDNVNYTRVAKAEKKPMTVEDIMATLNSLDIHSAGEWPLYIKVATCVLLAAIIAFVAHFFVMSSLRGSIDSARLEEQQKLAEYKDKDSKVRNLQLYQAQLKKMQVEFTQLLDQLPREDNVPDLVEEIGQQANASGSKIETITPQPEQAKELTIERPVEIHVKGDYHAFGVLVSGLASLPRIITLHDFTITADAADTKKANAVPILGMTLGAKTYRYNDAPKVDDKTNAGSASATANAQGGQ